MADTTDLSALRDLIHADTPAGQAARDALGLRWSAGPSRDYPARRLVSNYAPTTLTRWRTLRAAENSR